MYATLIKIGVKYVLPGLLVAALIAYAGYKTYDFGRDAERGEWESLERVRAEAHAADMEALKDAAELAARAHQLKIEEISNAKRDAVENLEHEVARVTARGLYVRTKNNCPRTSEGTDTGGAGSAPGRARLHEETGRNLIALTEEADQVVIQYEGCVNELLEHVDVMPSN